MDVDIWPSLHDVFVIVTVKNVKNPCVNCVVKDKVKPNFVQNKGHLCKSCYKTLGVKDNKGKYWICCRVPHVHDGLCFHCTDKVSKPRNAKKNKDAPMMCKPCTALNITNPKMMVRTSQVAVQLCKLVFPNKIMVHATWDKTLTFQTRGRHNWNWHSSQVGHQQKAGK